MAEAINIVERLRQNADMMRDGHQRNLTELWHSEVVRDAAKDADEAADRIIKSDNSLAALVKALQRARLFIDGLVQETEFKHRQPARGGRQELAAIDAALQEAAQ